MAVTLPFPVRFSQICNGFNVEGYGFSNSFNAFRRGGGIVPNTTPFNQIGLATVSEPLRMSQFNGFTIPSRTGSVFLADVGLDAVTTEYGDQLGSALSAVRMLNTGQFQGLVNENGGTTDWYNLFYWRTGGDSNFWSYKAFLLDGGRAGMTIINGGYTTDWLSTSNSPEWDVAAYTSAPFQRTAYATRQFRLDLALTTNTSNIVASAIITLNASSRTNSGEIP